MSSYNILDSIYINDINDNITIDLGDEMKIYYTTRKNIEDFILNKVRKLYKFMQDNILLFPYIIELCLDNNIILDYSLLINNYNVNSIEFRELREKIICDSISYTMDQEVQILKINKNSSIRTLYVINNGRKHILTEKEIKFKIYQKLSKNLKFILKELISMECDDNISNYIFKKFMEGYENLNDIELYISDCNKEHFETLNYIVTLVSDKTRNINKNLDDENMINNRSMFLYIINRIHNLYTSCDAKFDRNNIIFDVKKDIFDNFLYDRNKNVIGDPLISKVTGNFQCCNYVVANLDNQRKFFIKEQMHDNNFYLRAIDKKHPYTIIDYINSTFIGNNNIDFQCNYDSMFSKIFGNSNYSDFTYASNFSDITTKFIMKQKKIPFSSSKSNLVLTPITGIYNEYLNNMQHHNILWAFFNGLINKINTSFIDLIKEYNDTNNSNHTIICTSCKLILNDSNEIIDADDNIIIFMEMSIKNNNSKNSIEFPCFMISSNPQQKPICYYKSTCNINKDDDRSYDINSRKIVFTTNRNKSKAFNELLCKMKSFFISNRCKWQEYFQNLDNYFKNLIERFPIIDSDSADEFDIEFKYYYQFLNNNHPYLHTNKEIIRL